MAHPPRLVRDQLAAQDLPDGAPRDHVPKLEDPRDLVLREFLAAEPDELPAQLHRPVPVESPAAGHHHGLYVLVTAAGRHRHHHRFFHVGVRDDAALDLAGIDLAGRRGDEELEAPGDGQAAVVIQAPEVAGAKAAIAEGFATELLAPLVTTRQGGAGDDDLPHRARLAEGPVLVPHLHLDVADRPPHGLGGPGRIVVQVDRDGAGLAASVELTDRPAEALVAGLEDLARERRTRGETEAQGRQIGRLAHARHQPKHERHSGQDGHAQLARALEGGARVEAFFDRQRRSGGHRREDGVAETVGVEERRHAEDHIVGLHAHRGREVLGFVDQVGLCPGQALGHTGGARREAVECVALTGDRLVRPGRVGQARRETEIAHQDLDPARAAPGEGVRDRRLALAGDEHGNCAAL
jgi:hypothetical protein